MYFTQDEDLSIIGEKGSHTHSDLYAKNKIEKIS